MAHPIRLQIVNELSARKTCNVTQLTELLISLNAPVLDIYQK